MAEVDEVVRLRQQLAEAEARLSAIHDDSRSYAATGEVPSREPVRNAVQGLGSADVCCRQFLEQMGEGALAIDLHGNVLFCNRSFSELVNTPSGEVLGSSFEQLLAPPSREQYRAALALGQRARLSAHLQPYDGRRIPVQLALAPLTTTEAHEASESRDGLWRTQARWSVVVSDLAERERRAQAEAKHAEASGPLAEPLRMKEQFISAVGHELRGPLNAVLGWTQMLLEMPDQHSPQTVRGLQVIDRNARAQAKLIGDLLDVSRVASGKLTLERAPLDLMEVARAAASSALPQLEAKGVTLKLEAEGSLSVLGDGQRLQQVLCTLLGQAQQCTPKGGRVELRVQRQGERARIVVSDSGQGIEPEQLSSVFQLFHQGAGAARRGAGLGLGLHLSKQVVELHEGTISVASHGPGQGTTFTIDLPALQAVDDAEVSRTRAVDPALSFRGMRALLVDDEDTTREISARMLRKLGAEVVAVCDAASALARLEVDRFDLVVSDLMMPGTTGWELARAVRSRFGRSFPMMAVTGLDGADAREKAREAGFDAFVTKPLHEQALVRESRNLLHTSGSAARAAVV